MPDTWVLNANGQYDTFVEVDPNSDEYKTVIDHFQKTSSD